MEVRQKLVEIVSQKQEWLPNVGTLGIQTLRFVDHLIQNGVTIQKHGQWIGEADGYADGEFVYDVWYCSECNHCIDDGTDDPELLPNYCPNCGSKMKEDINE